MTVYADILFILNIYINYFLLKITASILHIKMKTSSSIISTLAAAASSFIIFLPPINKILLCIIKFLIALIIILIAFGKSKPLAVLKNTFIFFIVTCAFGGILTAVSNMNFAAGSLTYKNMTAYYPVSAAALAAFTIISYAAVSLVQRFIIPAKNITDDYVVVITEGNHDIELKGFADTGNTLVDMFSGKPVIVAGRKLIEPLLGIPANENIPDAISRSGHHLKGFRILPYSTCSSNSMIPVFVPDRVVIKNTAKKTSKTVDVLIGISQESTAAIFNPKILI